MTDEFEDIDERMQGIAVIGMAGRFPGTGDVDGLWRLLLGAREGLRRFTIEELRAAGFPEAQLRDPDFVPVRGVIDGADRFEADLFGYSPREAATIDPQQRLFLEASWAALEAAGYDPQRYPGSIGVYGSAGLTRYLLQNLAPEGDLLAAADGYQVMIANDKDFMTTRVSYKLGLRGPSMGIQTACSSSLVAVAQACLALLGNQCDIALAGGVSLALPLHGGYVYREGGIFAPDGHCRPFDVAARGTVLSSGVGLVVLRRFEDAWRDGDHIHAVIRGFGINNDGAAKAGYTAPSIDGQAEAISLARAMADVHAEEIGYVEAHGTGTPLGDPIEVAALTHSFREETRRRGYCALGSIKSNLGHLDTAAGVTGLIKAILCVERGVIPATLHFERPNPRLGIEETPFFVQARTGPWPGDPGRPRIAGVSAFGIGGTNAHMIVEAPPARPARAPTRGWVCIPLSAHSPEARARLHARLVEHVDERGELCLADAAFTAQEGRRHLPWRDVLVVEEGSERRRVSKGPAPRVRPASEVAPRVAFLFTGQGSQHLHMGRGLYLSEPVFRGVFDQCAEIARPLLDLDLRALVFPEGEALARDEAALTRTALAQPALFALEVALASLWRSVGVEPRVLLGHSLGEFAAAYFAGVFDLESALSLVVRRGALMDSVAPGAMLAVALTEAELLARLADGVELAAVNTPARCVATGTREGIEALAERLAAEGVAARVLATSHAMHSRMMDPILDDFCAAVRRAAPRPPAQPILSSVTGRPLTREEATDPTYWAAQLRRPVRFARGLESCVEAGAGVLVEIGPGNTLTTFAAETLQGRDDVEVVASARHPRQRAADPEVWLRAVGRLWSAGVPVRFDALQRGDERRRVPLPTYPFCGACHWLEREVESEARPRRSILAEGATSAGDLFDNLPPRLEPEQWLLESIWEPLPGERRDDEPLVWVVLDDGSSRCAAVLERLAAEDRLAGRCRARAELDLHEVVCRLGGRLLGLLSFWSHEGDTALSADSAEATIQRGFCDLAGVVGALQEVDGVALRRLISVTTGVLGEPDEGECRPEHAVALGPVLVGPVELDGLAATLVDLDGLAGDEAREVEGLLELLAHGHEASCLRLRRDGALLRRRHRPLILAPTRESASRELLRDGDVIVITGGLSGIGALFAEHVASTVRGRIALLGRRGPATPGADDLIARLEASGAEVVAIAVDLRDRAAVQGAVDAIDRRWGAPVRGVFHAAGLGGSGLVVDLDDVDRCAAFGSKVVGALHLDEALAGRGDPWWILCSSLAGHAFAMHLHGDYAAANAVVDALAGRWRQQGRRALSIAWDAWSIGMGAGRGMRSPLMRALGEAALTESDAPVALGLALSALQGGHARATICTRGAHFLDDPRLLPNRLRRGLFDAPAAETRSTSPRGGDSAVAAVQQVFAEALGLERIDVDHDFFDLGGHSLLAIEVASKLRKIYPVTLSAHTVLENPTPRRLAAMLGEGRDGREEGSAATSARRSGLLVELREGRRREPPLFLMHPVGGTVFTYRPLVHGIVSGVPIYGIRPRGLEGDEAPDDDVVAMARCYIDAARTVHPGGRWRLGGHSFGGVLAWEMAKQLRRAGEAVELLFMMDTPGPQEVPLELDDARAIDQYLREVGRSFVAQFEAGMEWEAGGGAAKDGQWRRYFELFRTHCRAMYAYQAAPLDGARLLYFKARSRDRFNVDRPEASWIDLALAGIEIHTVPGNHITMVAEEHVGPQSRVINACLGASSGAREVKS